MNSQLPEVDSPVPECIFRKQESPKSECFSKVKSLKSLYKKKKIASLELKLTNLKIKPIENAYKLTDHYDIISVLGFGTYASVKLARHKTTKREVAIKISRKQNSRQMLQNEYNVLRILEHDNIIKTHDLIQNNSRDESYLLLEYFEGKDLNQFIEDKKEVSLEESITIINQIVSAIHYLHSNGIAHRDLKPENILINEDLKVKLIDFNISKQKKVSRSETDLNKKFSRIFFTQICSPLYAAPELKKSCLYTESIDIWGIGIIMFTLLYGNIQQYKTIVTDENIGSHELLTEVIESNCIFTSEVKDFLKSLLAEEPHLRPSSDELLASDVLNKYVKL